MPNHRLPTHGLDISQTFNLRTGQVADWTTHGLVDAASSSICCFNYTIRLCGHIIQLEMYYKALAKSYKNLTFLPSEIEEKVIMFPALRITVKPALGDHPFVKLKLVAQNRWSLNEGLLTETRIVTIVTL